MKRVLLAVLVMLCFCGTGNKAVALGFDDFSLYVSETFLNPFAKDLGSLLGGGVTSGNNPGFPGFDFSAKLIMVSKPLIEDMILPQNQLFLLPIGQVEIGLPMDFILIVRGITSDTISILGGGIKYKLLKEDISMPCIAISATYNYVSGVADFDANTISFNAIISKTLAVITLYGAAGVDMTTITSKVAGFTGIKGTATGYRAQAGVKLGLFPFVYINADAGLVNGNLGYNGGVGVSF